jgi:hypothetical protein
MMRLMPRLSFEFFLLLFLESLFALSGLSRSRKRALCVVRNKSRSQRPPKTPKLLRRKKKGKKSKFFFFLSFIFRVSKPIAFAKEAASRRNDEAIAISSL